MFNWNPGVGAGCCVVGHGTLLAGRCQVCVFSKSNLSPSFVAFFLLYAVVTGANEVWSPNAVHIYACPSFISLIILLYFSQ